MTTVAKELLRVQKKALQTALLWIDLLENPEATKEERAIIAKNYASCLNNIFELQAETLGIDLTTEILSHAD